MAQPPRMTTPMRSPRAADQADDRHSSTVREAHPDREKGRDTQRGVNTNAIANAAALSDRDLLASLSALAGREREASVELVAHLAALDARPSVYLAQGYGSLHP